LTELTATHAGLDAEMKLAQATIRELRAAQDVARRWRWKRRRKSPQPGSRLRRKSSNLASERARASNLESRVRELEVRSKRDEDTMKEMGADLAAWQERKRHALAVIAPKVGNARGFWRDVIVSSV
jgi:uncharacterized coiled-coil protein SlyX